MVISKQDSRRTIKTESFDLDSRIMNRRSMSQRRPPSQTPQRRKPELENEVLLTEASSSVDRLRAMELDRFEWVTPENLEEDVTEALKVNESVLIIGDAGWGKSSIVAGAANSLGMFIEDFRVGQVSPEDIGGIPKPTIDKDGEDSFKVVSFSWVNNILINYKKTGKPTIIFLDEINHGRPEVLNTCYQIILDRRVGSIKLGDACRVVAAMNFFDENRDTNSLSSPLVERFDQLFIAPSDWADAVKFLSTKYPDHAAFLQLHVRDWDELRNPRNVERIIRQIDKGMKVSSMRLKDGQLKKSIDDYVADLRHGDKSRDSSEISEMRQKINAAIAAVSEGFVLYDSNLHDLSQGFTEESLAALAAKFGLDEESLEVVQAEASKK